MRNIDSRAILRPRHGIFDRLAAAFGDATHDQPGRAGVDVHLEIDWSEDWLVHLLQRCGEDLEDRGAGHGVLARSLPSTAHHRSQATPLAAVALLSQT